MGARGVCPGEAAEGGADNGRWSATRPRCGPWAIGEPSDRPGAAAPTNAQVAAAAAAAELTPCLHVQCRPGARVAGMVHSQTARHVEMVHRAQAGKRAAAGECSVPCWTCAEGRKMVAVRASSMALGCLAASQSVPGRRVGMEAVKTRHWPCWRRRCRPARQAGLQCPAAASSFRPPSTRALHLVCTSVAPNRPHSSWAQFCGGV